MAFKLSKRVSSQTESPEALFRDLRNRTVEGLLAQQADMLRKYMEHVEDRDVALQMPTGSGKTLVGLLIAEWRRRTRQERAVYLCPTKQLVNQVVEQARTKYGIHAVPFTGPQVEYSQVFRGEYINSESLAISTYNGLFNTNTFFNNAQVILLDDVHAAENYVADFWSLTIDKSPYRSLFESIASVIKEDIAFVDQLRLAGKSEENPDPLWTNKLPGPALYGKHDELVSLLDTHCISGTDLYYKWKVLREHLNACNLFYSRDRILIRPLIPPAECHPPFASANQRIYMSATLGEGGELERLVGKRVLTRIPAPPGWDRQGIGRRLFFFPERSLVEGECIEMLVQMIQKANRALILTPSDREASRFREIVRAALPQFTLFGAPDLEASKHRFVSTNEAVAIIANRYDGIDLAGDECRLLIASGLPRATNLQEQFLMSRLGASVLYEDRIRTRMVQAIGRCTRSATDYAAIVILGEQLNKFFLQPDSRQFLHPEQQAEIEFGLEESKAQTREQFEDNLAVFLEHKEDWQKADEYIVEQRNSIEQNALPCVENFKSAVPSEVAYQYALWNQDYVDALEAARKVLTSIEGPEKLRGYRAFWLYLAGNAALLASMPGRTSIKAIAHDYYQKASKAAHGITWMHELARLRIVPEEINAGSSAALDMAIERLEHELESLGTVQDRAFDQRVKEILDGLQQTEARRFEHAQVLLGRLLGYDADNSNDSSAPDPWWMLSETEGIVFEDYTDCLPTAVISTEKVRQTNGHPKWLKDNEKYRGVRFYPVLVTSAKELGQGARPHAKDCYYWEVDSFVKWAKGAIDTIRHIRRTYSDAGDLLWRGEAKAAYMKANMDPAGLVARACQVALSTLPESGRR